MWGWRRVLIGALVGGLAWLVAGAVLVAASVPETFESRSELQDLRAELDLDALREPEGALGRLERARRGFETAHGRVRSPLTLPLRALPVLGRQVRMYGALSGASAEAITIGTRTLEDAERLLERRWGDDGDARIEAIEQMHVLVETAREGIAALGVGSGTALVGPVADAWEAFQRDRAEVVDALDRAGTIAAGLASFYRGPRTYLLLAANNAEMRAGSGMFLSVGELRVERGRFIISEMEPSWEHNPPAGAVTPSGDLAARWGWVPLGEDFRHLAHSPRFPPNARLAAEMWAATHGRDVDGVITVDPVALERVLAATGPVEVDSRRFGPGSVVPYVLNEQYHDIDPDPEAYDETQAGRRDALGSLARATVEAVAGDVDPVELAVALRYAGRRRHMMAWSPHRSDQRLWETAGVHGELEPDALLVAMLNRSGTKLDYFLRVNAELDIDRHGGGTRVAVHVRARNAVPPGQPRYVRGPHPRVDAERGEYVGIIAVSIPAEARDETIDGVDEILVGGPDGPARVIATPVRIPAGEEVIRTVRFELPPHIRHIRLAPSARVPPVRWHHAGAGWQEGTRPDIRW